MNENLKIAIEEVEAGVSEVTQRIGPMAVQGELQKAQEGSYPSGFRVISSFGTDVVSKYH